jgi:RNA polymerase-associated protein RTF1
MDGLEEELLLVAGRRGAGRKRSRKPADSDDDDDYQGKGSGSDDYSDDEEDRPRKSSKRSAAGGKKGAKAGESEDDDPDDPYDSDLYIDEADRQELAGKTELEREMILAERAEERDRIKQRKEILRRAREKEQVNNVLSAWCLQP